MMETQEAKWTRYAEVYDKRRYALMPGYRDMLNTVTQALPFHLNDTFTILEIGTGTGNLSDYILSYFPNAQLTGVDISEGMLNVARTRLKNYGSRFVLQRKDLETDQIEGQYDAVVSSLTFRCLSRLRKLTFLQEVYEALTPNGITIHADVLLVPDGYIGKQNKVIWDRTKQHALNHGLITEAELLEEERRREEYDKGDRKALDDFLTPEQFLYFFRDNRFPKADFIWQYWGLSVIAAQK